MIKEIREHYGIPQQLFSDYLMVSRSQLSMAETGMRNLPADQSMAVYRLFQAIALSKSKTKDEKLEKLLTAQKSLLKKTISDKQYINTHKLKLLENSLEKMKRNQDRCVKVLESLKSLKVNANKKDEMFFSIIEGNTRRMLSESGENAQFEIELEIHNLQNEITYLQNRS